MLTAHLKHRGFNGASLVALRVMTEGIESGLLTVLLAFYWSIEDARAEWRRRHGR